jgi:hypothetical protein
MANDPAQAIRPPVLLLGMHRSGTSVATRLLVLLGLAVPEGRLIPPDEYNPGGYWESRALTDVGDLVLEALGSPWFAPPDVAEVADRQSELDALLPGALEEARRAFPGDRTGVWKDPRTCVLLPFWERVFGSTAPVVVVHRHPLEVADSLRRRQGFAVPYSLALWERYTRGALAGPGSRPVHVESYAGLVEDAGGWLDRVSDFLRRQGVELHSPPSTVGDEVARGRASSSWSADELSVLTAEQRALRDVLSSLDGGSSDRVARELPRESPTTASLLDLGRDGWAVRRALDAAREGTARTAATADELQRTVESQREELLAQEARLQDCETRLGATLAALDAESARSAVDLREREDRLKETRERLRYLEETLDAVYASHSWRATAPLRGAVAVGRASARRLRCR